MAITYFAKKATVNGLQREELWVTDGTVAGTRKVASLPTATFIANPFTIGNRLYFGANDSTSAEQLWSSDGTAAGTSILASIAPYPGNQFSYPINLNGTLYFTAFDGTHGVELWKTDGSTAGTVMVADINPGSANSSPAKPVVMNGVLYFIANDGVHGGELWRSDGTSAGTYMVADLNPGAANGGPGSTIGVAGGFLFFSADDGQHNGNYVLYRSNGTAGGTVFVKDVAYPSSFITIGSTVYFTGSTLTGGAQIWRTDGTDAGTIALTSFATPGNQGMAFLTECGGNLYFFGADSQTSQTGLWRLGGGPHGATFIAAVDTANQPISWNGVLYFSGYDSVNGRELWKSDGTAAGTVRLTNINAGSGSSNPGNFRVVNGQLQFVAFDGTALNLYVTDGTNFTMLAAGVDSNVPLTVATSIAARSDLNGDGTSDILWFNSTIGAVNDFQMHSGVGTWGSYGGIDTAWDAKGQGDFNGDGIDDILFRRGQDGALGYFQTNATGTAVWTGMGAVDANWQVAAIGDVNGDGTDDIIFSNPANGTVGYLEMHNGTGTWHGIGFVNPAWKIAGAGDVNGDGTADIIYYNQATGDLNFLGMSAATGQGTWAGIARLGPAWTIAGVGDFNGDGIADILAYNASVGGALNYLEMHNGVGTWRSFKGVGAIGTAWTVAAVGDYNGDGLSDILFYNASASAVGLLTQTATNTPVWSGLGPVSSAWHVV